MDPQTAGKRMYFLDSQLALEAGSIEEAQQMGEAIIGEISEPSESLVRQGIEAGTVTFMGGSIARAREDKPVEYVQFGSDRPYSNTLALHPERESATA